GLGLEALRDLQAVETGQLNVHEDQPRPHGLRDAERLLAVAGGPDVEALALEREPRDLEVLLVIVDDQDGTERHGRAPAATACSGIARGSTAWNTLPLPNVLRAPTVPPCASTMRRVSASPRPVPW